MKKRNVANNELTDILQVEGVNSKGYGIIPKLVMQDPRLSPEAKCIYAYFCSYAGAGSQAFPSVPLILSHLGMSKTRYYSHIGLLKEYGYIRTEQQKSNGKFKKTIYILCTNPTPVLEAEENIEEKIEENTEASPCPSFKDTVKTAEKPCPSFVDTGFVDTENRDTNINRSLKLTVINNNNLSINQQEDKKAPATDSAQNEKTENKKQENNSAPVESGAGEVIYNLEYLHNQFQSDTQEQGEHGQTFNELVELIHDVVNSKTKKIKVNGDSLPGEVVRARLIKLKSTHLNYVIGNFKQQTGEIRNVRSYLITSLYNSYTSLSSHNASQDNKELKKVSGFPEAGQRSYIPQSDNFTQRQYDDEFYESLYENK